MAVNIFGTDYSLATEGFDITPDVTVLQAANNLSDVGSVATSRTNLGVCSITELGASGGVSIHWDNLDTGDVFSCTNQANNRVVTALSTDNSFNAENNMSFDSGTGVLTMGQLTLQTNGFIVTPGTISIENNNLSTTPTLFISNPPIFKSPSPGVKPPVVLVLAASTRLTPPTKSRNSIPSAIEILFVFFILLFIN